MGSKTLARREHLLLALIFVAALGVRALHWWGQMRHNPFFHAPVMDEKMHHEWAQLIATGEGLGDKPFFRSPLYYYVVAGVYALFGPSLTVARFVGIVIGAASCYLVARIGTLLGGLRVGLLAGMLAAFYWPLIHFDEQLLTVGVEIFLNLLMLWLLLVAVERDGAIDASRTVGETAPSRSRLGATTGAKPGRFTMVMYGLAGVVWGLSALARPNVLAFAPGLVIWLWVVLRSTSVNRRGTGQRRVPDREPLWKWAGQSPVAKRIAVVCLGAAVAILPVTLRNRIVGGEWVLIATNGGVNFYIGNNPQSDGIAAVVPGTRADWRGGYEDTHRIPEEEHGRKLTEGEVSTYWFRKGVAWIRSDPGAWLRLTLHKLRLFWVPYEIPNNQPIRYFAGLSEISRIFILAFPPAAVLGLAGLTTLRGRWRLWSLPVLFAVIAMAAVVIFFCPARYRLPIVPILLLLTAGGLARLPELWRSRRWRTLGAYAAVAVGVTIFLVANRADAMWAQQEEGRAYQDLGLHYARRAHEDPAFQATALDYLRRAAELRPNDPNLRHSLATWLTHFDHGDEAGPHFARAVALLPTLAEARYSYGDWLFTRGRMAEAVEQYQAALEWRPDWVDTRYQLGRALARTGQVAPAVEQFEAVVRQKPELVPALFDLATALVRLDRPTDAAHYYRELLRVEPAHVAASQRLARVLFQSGQVADAIAVLEAGSRQAPGDPTLRADLAGLLVSTADPAVRNSARAAALAEEALDLGAARDVTLLDTLATAYADLGRLERAVELTREALAKAREAGPASAVPQLEARLRRYENDLQAP